jgi:hypothetical protein
MHIVVKQVSTNDTTIVYVEASDTIAAVKAKIQDTVGHPVYQQRLGLDPKDELWTSWGERRLIWGGPELQDERTLSHYDIQKGTVLYLSLRLISIRMGLRASDKLHPDYIGAL